MKNITTGNIDGALQYVSGPDEAGVKEFITKASESSEGSYTLMQRTMQNGKAYFLYDLSSENGKMARTIVEKGESGWKVNSYVYGSDNLALVPGDASTSEETTTTTTEPAATPASTKECLVKDDFKKFWKEKFGDNAGPLTLDFSKNGTSDNVHFKPHSLEYAAGSSDDTILPYAHFARDYKDKDFTIEYYGGVGTDDPAFISLADRRAEKVKKVLLKNGASEDQLVLYPAITVNKWSKSYNSIDQGRTRVVVFRINPSKACGGQGSFADFQ